MKINVTHIILGLSIAFIYACNNSESKTIESPETLEEFISDRVWTDFESSFYLLDSTKEIYIFVVPNGNYDKPIGTPVSNRILRNEASNKSGWVYVGEYKINDAEMTWSVIGNKGTLIESSKVDFIENVNVGSFEYTSLLWGSPKDTLYSVVR